jgi:predicted permease
MINLRLALRTLFRSPFVTVVAIVSLALGIGANAAIFSLFDQVLLRPLPVRNPGELVNLAAPGPKPGSQSCNQAGDCDEVFSYAMFRDLQRVQRVFTGLAAHRPFSTNLSFRKQTVNGDGVFVSGDYFPLLGIHAARGRLLGPQDDKVIGQAPVVVLSYEYWHTHFNDDPDVLNQPLTVNGQSLTIVGVTPKGFRGTTLGSNPFVFVPITLRALLNPTFKGFENRRDYWVYLFARLKPGVTLVQARAALNTQYHAIVNDVEAPIQKEMSAQTLKRFRAKSVGVVSGPSGQSQIRGPEARDALTMLLGVTILVLVIACVNIANLLLARGATRAGEITIRLSIGAGRWRLVAQLLTESLLLALVGGLVGLLFAKWTLDLVVALLPAEAVATVPIGLDSHSLLYAAALTVATALLFGLFPALHTTRADLTSALKGQAGQPAGARAAAIWRTSLATAQIALSMALLVCAGLFVRSLSKVSRVDLGVRVDNTITFAVSPRLSGYEPARSRALFERLEGDLKALPGVASVTAAAIPLMGGSNWGNDVAVEGFAAGPDTDVNADVNETAPGYFDTLGVRLLAGRDFTATDALGAPKVAIVNETFTKKFNLGRNAVGRRMARGGGKGATLDIEIVGVMQDTKYSDVKRAVRAQFMQPYRQDETIGGLFFYVRASRDAEALVPTIRKVVARADPDLPIENLRTLEAQVRESMFFDRFVSVLSSAFAGLATLLAAIGLYGVLAYNVAQRTREIGLRMALGAAPTRVRRMVLGQVSWMIAVGGGIGLGAAFWLGRLVESILFQMKGRDPMVLASSAVLLTFVAFGAGFLPALRASRIDPMRALRYE